MRRAMLAAAAVLAPLPARAEELAGGGNFSFLASFVQMIASLAVVVGVILLFYYVSNRWLKAGAAARGGERHIRIVETRFVAPKKSLLLVEVAGEYLLLGNSGDRLNLIKQVEILDEIEVLDEQETPAPVSDLFQRKLELVVGKLSARLPKGIAGLKNGNS